MSIIITAIQNNRKFYICSDKRARRLGKITDNFQKIFDLSPQIYFGITGTAEPGLSILEKLQGKSFNDELDVINIIDNIFQPIGEELTITVGGKCRNNFGYFLWNKNNEGIVKHHVPTNTDIIYSIASRDENRFEQFFKNTYQTCLDLEKTIIKTIEYAATIDDSISKYYDMFML